MDAVMKSINHKTKMIQWRGGLMEFCATEGGDTKLANPPWYVVRYRGGVWDSKLWNYAWIDYGGPPEIFLTRRQAEKRAIAFRKQYKSANRRNGPVKVEVAEIGLLKEKK